MSQQPQDAHQQGGQQQGQNLVVMTQQGMGVAGDDAPNPAEQVERPDKVMRIGSMVKQLLDEVRSAPLDERGRARMAEVHQRSLAELEDGLAPELVEELRRIAPPLSPEQAPSDAELRIAQAQLVGWLEGLFHGIQTAVFAQQMAARAQLEQMRRALPGGQPGSQPGSHPGSQPGSQQGGHQQSGQPGGPPPGAPGQPGTGQYL
ncbi:bacterial proteasome activator family protein [Pseudokineococcus basanitobsidens]|uniref:Bacterial proteasome activator n=1 Tax=Pseudokineococcus basanitobsidens TaxID=1926649 RepID=A0ABU8RKD6_9ACTN